MAFTKTKESGFVLAVSMIFLVILSILLLSNMRSTLLNERMAGIYSDRTRAMSEAERGLRAGDAILIANAETCVSGCDTSSGLNGVGSYAGAATMPNAWPGGGSYSVTTTSAYYIQRIDDSYLPNTKSNCKAYSILARGKGSDNSAAAVVILQKIVFLCPSDI